VFAIRAKRSGPRNRAAVPDDYELVQEFSVELGKFPALDALVIVDIICSQLAEYSVLQHMCYLQAAVVVLSMKLWAESQLGLEVALVDGPMKNKAGKFRGIRSVDIQTGTLHTERSEVLTQYKSKDKKRGVTVAFDDIVSTVMADIARFSNPIQTVTAPTIVALATVKVPETKSAIEAKCEVIFRTVCRTIMLNPQIR
jgi:hypothetical protein